MKVLRVFSVVLALLFLSAPAFAGIPSHLPFNLKPLDDPGVPSAFQGIWNYTEVFKDCTTMEIFTSDSGTDTVCANDSAAPPDTASTPGIFCEYTSSSNQYTVHCTGSQEITPGCNQDYVIDATSMVSGSTVTSVTTINITYTGCGPLPSTCYRYEYTGTRIGPATEECATPVEPTTWSGIKAYYR